MSIISCEECGNHVSTKAKECPHCGARFSKRAVFLLLALVCIVVCVVYYWSGNEKHDTADVKSDSNGVVIDVNIGEKCVGLNEVANLSCRRDEVERLFKSGSESVAENALWVGDSTFKVSVVDNGLRRDAYAMYVCNVLSDRGLGGKGIVVQIVDGEREDGASKSSVLGESRCD